ncbi:MAG: AmmeMemoRadiSam system protein B [Acidimicrobiales bacterium]
MTTRVRFPAVAGLFYPKDARSLAAEVDRYLAARRSDRPAAIGPKVIVVPHAGYRFSAAVAAHAYALVDELEPKPTRVVLLGPSHTVPLRAMAVSAADVWRTPLGDVAVDRGTVDDLATLPGVVVDEVPHMREHALEEQVPFLQRLLPDGFELVPVVVGHTEPGEVAALLDRCWGTEETLIVISTDLSHYLPLPEAQSLDRVTVDAVLAGDLDAITTDRACGAMPLKGAVVAAKRHGLQARLLAMATSADAGGDHWRVVGYGSFAYASAA